LSNSFTATQLGLVLQSLAGRIGSVPRILLPDTAGGTTEPPLVNPASPEMPLPDDRPVRIEKVGNVDGSPWIRNQIQRQSLPLDALGLDFFHLSENVHKARREIYGDEGESGKKWAGDLLHVFKHEGYEPAWQRLLEWRVGLRCRQREAADRLLNYVSERREMINYPEFQSNGWQIGSGPTEATCKTLTARLKGSGMRRDADNAEAIMAVEALTQSGQWDFYWRSQLEPAG
jgi:hypothetical protein